MDYTKLVGKVSLMGLSKEEIAEVTGSKRSGRYTLGFGGLTIGQLGRFCSLLNCQPSELLELGENECEKFLKAKTKDFSAFVEMCGDNKIAFHRETEIPLTTVYDPENMSMPTACMAAVALGCRISDFVDMEDVCE